MTTLKQVKDAVEKYQCPGCVVGSDVGCGSFKRDADGGCLGHVVGTYMVPGGHTMLGMPKGFQRTKRQYMSPADRMRQVPRQMETAALSDIRIVTDAKPDRYNHLNVPVWALEDDGFLLVRVFMPRIDHSAIDIIPGGKMADLCPLALDVSKFQEEIDG